MASPYHAWVDYGNYPTLESYNRRNIILIILYIFYRFPHLAIIAHFLIFQYDKGMHLDSEENIENYLQHAYKMGPHIQHNFGGLKTLSFSYIENLVSTLNIMARFFAQHVVWKDIGKKDALTLQKYEVCAQLNALEKNFKICHIFVIRKPT